MHRVLLIVDIIEKILFYIQKNKSRKYKIIFFHTRLIVEDISYKDIIQASKSVIILLIFQILMSEDKALEKNLLLYFRFIFS